MKASEHINELFNLIENENSPFVISKRGKAALDALCKEKSVYQMYRRCIQRSLSVRIVQKCRSFYKNMKLSKLQTLLQFYASVPEVEKLLYEFNRENLVHTTISYENAKNEGFLTFNPESQVG